MEGQDDSVINAPTGLISSVSNRSEAWDMFGRKVPKAEIVFFTQVAVIYIVVIACIVNLSMGNTSELWVVLMSTCLGAILPHPDLKELKRRSH